MRTGNVEIQQEKMSEHKKWKTVSFVYSCYDIDGKIYVIRREKVALLILFEMSDIHVNYFR